MIRKIKTSVIFMDHQNISTEKECPICMLGLPLVKDSSSVVTICGHEYHRVCLREALKRSPACPLCRCTLRNERIEHTSALNVTNQTVLFVSVSAWQDYQDFDSGDEVDDDTDPDYFPF